MKDKLGIKKSYTLAQLRTKGAYQVSFGLKGKGITYSVKEDLEKTFKDAGIKGMAFEATTSRMYNGTLHQSFLVVLNLLKIKRWFLFFDWSNGFGAFA